MSELGCFPTSDQGCKFDDTDLLYNILLSNGNIADIIGNLDTLLFRYRVYFNCIKFEELGKIIDEISSLQNTISQFFPVLHVLSCFIADETMKALKKKAQFKNEENILLEDQHRLHRNELEDLKGKVKNLCFRIKMIFTLKFLPPYDLLLILFYYTNNEVLENYFSAIFKKLDSANIIYTRHNTFLAHGGFVLNGISTDIDRSKFKQICQELIRDINSDIEDIKTKIKMIEDKLDDTD